MFTSLERPPKRKMALPSVANTAFVRGEGAVPLHLSMLQDDTAMAKMIEGELPDVRDCNYGVLFETATMVSSRL